MSIAFSLRQMIPDESRVAVNALSYATPDMGYVPFAFEHLDAPYRVLEALYGPHDTVLAISPDVEGLIGSGTLSYKTLRIQGQHLPAAYKNTLMVHPIARRQGVAKAISQWRVQQAQARLGAEHMVYVAIQQGNIGSEKATQSWCNHFLPGRMLVYPAKPRRQPPAKAAYQIAPLQSADVSALVEQLNQFYQDYELYVPRTIATFQAWLAQDYQGQPLHQYWVVKDAQGQLLAGIGLKTSFRLSQFRILHMPTPVRLLNALFRVIPANHILRQLSTDQFWYAPNQEQAARLLWEHLRYEWRDQVDTLLHVMDAYGPFPQLLGVSRWTPTTQLSLAFKGPIAPDDRRLCYFQQ